MTEEKIKELEEVSKPLMKFLADNFHPHTKAIVEYNKVEVLEGLICLSSNEFISD